MCGVLKMRKIILVVLLSNLTVVCHADESVKSSDTSWYNSAKSSASKAFNNTKEAAGIGLDKTTTFINKTGQATKQGYNAFKKSFNNDKAKSDTIKSSNKALPPAYLRVKGFKSCLAIKDMGTYQVYCLPKYRAVPCEKSIFEKLIELKSPDIC